MAAIFETLQKLAELLARLKTTQKARERLEKARAGILAKNEETRGRITRERMQRLAAIFENLGQGEQVQGLAKYWSGHLENSGQVME